MSKRTAAIKGEDHWTSKNGCVKLFLFEKFLGDPAKSIGTILFVHGSSMASQPTFDLQVSGRPDSSAMDHFARRGYDCWCVDMEGYGRSTKDRYNNAPISQGAEDCRAACKTCARCHGVDRRRFPHSRATAQETSGVCGQKPASDRQGFHSFDLRSRPS